MVDMGQYLIFNLNPIDNRPILLPNEPLCDDTEEFQKRLKKVKTTKETNA
jgi:hypothetical protein